MGLGSGSARRRIACLALGVCALVVASVGVAGAVVRDFENPASNDPQQQFGLPPVNPQRADTPNDPDYDYAETDDPDSTLNGGSVTPSTNIYDERFDLFGFPSERTRLSALYTAGPNAGMPQISGFNASGAWKVERGRSDVTVAVLDTGIKWDKTGLRTQIHLNRGELPVPQHGDGSDCGCATTATGTAPSTSSTTPTTPASTRTAGSTACRTRSTPRT